jgi:hypothetical protein
MSNKVGRITKETVVFRSGKVEATKDLDTDEEKEKTSEGDERCKNKCKSSHGNS